MPDTIKSKTGTAPIKRTGHTASAKHGANENAKVRGGSETRDLKIK